MLLSRSGEVSGKIMDRCVHPDVHNGPLSSLSTRAEAVPVIVVAGEVLVDLVVSADGRVDARLGGGDRKSTRLNSSHI